jgi:hypothetical protein
MRLNCPLWPDDGIQPEGSARRATRQKKLRAHMSCARLLRALRALMWLLANAQTFDDGFVPVLIRLLQVVEKTAAASDQFQEAAAAVMILRVRLEVLRQVGDAVREECDLHFWRSGIDVMDSIRGYELSFLLFRGWQIRVSLRLKPL